MHVLLDPRISPSQTHGFNSLWKMSSETHAIQKNSPYSTVPLKSNEKLAVFIKIRFCCCNAHNHDRDPRISPSQTHGFNSLWKTSSETCVIQKDSPQSIVPLKSNDEPAADPLCSPFLPMWGRPTERQPSPNCAHSSVGWLPYAAPKLEAFVFVGGKG